MFSLGRAIGENITFWTKLFPQAWESLSWEGKLVWLAFVGQTLAIITLIEMLLLR